MANKTPTSRKISNEERRAAWDALIKLRLRNVSLNECAKQLGFHVNTIEKWVAKPEWKARFIKSRAELYGQMQSAIDDTGRVAVMNVEQTIKRYSIEALDKIYALMTDVRNNADVPSRRLALKAAIDLADRGPETSKVKKIQSAHLHAMLSPEMLAASSQAAREIGQYGKPIQPVELNTADLQEMIEDEF